jgi:hypothetical protein
MMGCVLLSTIDEEFWQVGVPSAECDEGFVVVVGYERASAAE